jgi:hypothetical protein
MRNFIETTNINTHQLYDLVSDCVVYKDTLYTIYLFWGLITIRHYYRLDQPLKEPDSGKILGFNKK